MSSECVCAHHSTHPRSRGVVILRDTPRTVGEGVTMELLIITALIIIAWAMADRVDVVPVETVRALAETDRRIRMDELAFGGS